MSSAAARSSGTELTRARTYPPFPSLLNYPGAELLLVPSKHTAKEDIGDAAEKELDDEEKALEKEIDKQDGGGSEAKKVLKEMGFEGLQGVEALQGHWE